ncbi:MAG: hypothetical protein HC941_00495 [Microcoleus sp. SU_5_3]|nr:hypothetical protein [Microcoleus sp. SU_5_3]
MQKVTHSNFHKTTRRQLITVQLWLCEERNVSEALLRKAIAVSIFHRVLSISISYLNRIEPQPVTQIQNDKQVSFKSDPETMTALTQIEERRDYYHTCINGGY